MSGKIDKDLAPTKHGTGYPPPFDQACKLRQRWKLGDAAGLTQFGVNLMRLPPGQWSSQRHWHSREDEFVYVLEGEVWLVTDAGEEKLLPGDCAGFPAGVKNGHHLQNRSTQTAVLLEVGTRAPGEDFGDYPDIDMRFDPEGFKRKNGTPYGDAKRLS